MAGIPHWHSALECRVLSPGTRLGSYDVVSKLGEGGMGEVYRARDLKLNRDVAIKILPSLFASDPDRLVRFEREAHTLASLNHPNIAQIYGVVDAAADGSHESGLVMELVDGDDLAERIARGPLPMEDALANAAQIAEALEAAHDQGIVHRDLKPANIKVRPDGTLKVLDFGLAKAFAHDPVVTGSVSNSPTFTSPPLRPGAANARTEVGVIMGTAAYMAPEQARGKSVDRRADIWSFGLVLYEMLTGKTAFAGETVTDTISAIVSRDPDWMRLPPSTPPHVRRLLRRCLEKDPRKRLQAIGEARIALSEAPADMAGTAAPSGRGRAAAALTLGGVAALAAGAAVMWFVIGRTGAVPQTTPAHVDLPLTPADRLEGRFGVSPDGRTIAFVGRAGSTRKLYVRRLDSEMATVVASAEVSNASDPHFSPDGKWIAFNGFGVLEKVPVDGGPTTVLARAGSSTVTGVAWGPDDTIVFSNPSLGLSKVSANGGEAQVIASTDTKAGEIGLEDPLIMPDGKTVLYDVRRAAASANSGTTTIMAQPLSGGPRQELFPGMAVGLIGDDQLVVSQADALVVIPFDTRAMKATGPARPLLAASTIERQPLLYTTAPLVSVARNGTLVYQPAFGGETDSPMAIVDRTGVAKTIDLPPHRYSDPRASPDGTRVVVHGFEGERDNWVVDVRRGTLTRLTFDPAEDETPIWSPDGQWIYWTATRANLVRGVYRRAADGSGTEELLWTADSHVHLFSATPDGATLIISIVEGQHNVIAALHLADKKLTALVSTPFVNADPALSADGRWLAYTSNESGREEVYVQPYPSMSARTQVSVSGGTEPVWSRRGRELFYRANGKVMVVGYDAGDRFTASEPRALIPDVYDSTQGSGHTGWDVLPDGRFLFVTRPAAKQAPVTSLKLLLR
jgi:Tol biopolymer transport system component